MKKIGVLTSGGDTPGMNSAIRAVFKEADARGMDVMGIFHGYKGLIEGRIRQLTHEDVANVMHKGGTVLRTARSSEFMQDGGFEKALNMLHAYDIDGLIIIGGDGSYRGAKKLYENGIMTIGLPGTIDNDIGYTDFTIGFAGGIASAGQYAYSHYRHIKHLRLCDKHKKLYFDYTTHLSRRTIGIYAFLYCKSLFIDIYLYG